MKFSIRDLLFLTVIVALALGWWVDHGRQSRDRLAVELLLSRAEAERAEAVEDRAVMRTLMHELMQDLDVIHPGWRWEKWQEIPKPIFRDTDARKTRQRGKAWEQFQAMKNQAPVPNPPKSREPSAAFSG